VRPENEFVQRVTARPGHRYVLRHFSRAEPPQSVRLQLNWARPDGSLLKADIKVVPATDSWVEHQLIAEAPEGSAFVGVYVSTQSGAALFDDYFFAEIPPAN
jgi:hypothetical protein